MALMRIRPAAPALMGTKPGTDLVSSGEPGREARLYAVKGRIHHRLLERLDFPQLETLDHARMALEIRQVLNQLLEDETEPLNLGEKVRLVEELEFEILGLGPLEPLLKDPTISDILVNRYDQVYIERRGRLELTAVRFQDDEHLLKIINKIVSNVGRRIDESTPMVDARLPDGSRVNAIIPPWPWTAPCCPSAALGSNAQSWRIWWKKAASPRKSAK
jgi:pilus assembly protein CpaF